MTRRLPFIFLAACGGSASAQAQPVFHAQPAPPPPPATRMQVAQPHQVHFTGTGFVAYGAMLQPAGDTPRTTDEGPAPHSKMDVADVQCQAENVTGSPFKVTCTNGKPSSIDETGGKQFRDRLDACFHTNVVALPPQVLRAMEASFVKGSIPLMPGARPSTTTVPFISVDVDSHVVSKQTEIAIVEDDCKGVNHPCDPVRRRIVGYKPADPNTPATETRARTFVGFGPEGYEVRPNVGSPGPIFRAVGVKTIYAAPMLDGDKPDTRFVVQRYAYPPLAWEPPTVSEDSMKATYARIVALDPDREDDATQIAIFLDRAVLAFAMHDGDAGKRHVRDLDAWLAKHPTALPSYDYVKTGIEALHVIESGKLTVKDPCAS